MVKWKTRAFYQAVHLRAANFSEPLHAFLKWALRTSSFLSQKTLDKRYIKHFS